MNSKTNLRIIVLLITVIAITSIGFKLKPVLENYDDFSPEKVYKVKYSYFFKSADKNTYVKTFIPQDNARQRISGENAQNNSTLYFNKKEGKHDNIRAIWNTKDKNIYHSVDYEFTFEGKDKSYIIPNTFIKASDSYKKYLEPTLNIQSDDEAIVALATKLAQNAENDKEIIRNIFDHVLQIPSAPIITLTDALTAIQQNKASCNGKSRLFIALSRNLGYPARIKGGIIAENANKRTSHVWAEVLINETWIPFDTLNNHFAYIPSNYLEIYTGDEFLITHTSGIQFDYTYLIHEVNHINFLKMNASEIRELSGISLWQLVESGVIPKNSLDLLLLLPLGGLLVAFLRNVVGVKTFGIFLPVLIAFSLLHIGFLSGIILFVGLILLVGLISYPFDKIGLLYTPKLVVSLTIMVGLMIIATTLGLKYHISWLTTLTFFPTIILTIAAERFSRATIEDGYKMAVDKLFQTLIATTICFGLLSWQALPSILIIFPEVILLIITSAILLGRYIGIRWVEFYRFKPLFN
ncbi:7TM domain-containing protein [Aquimarina sp. 2201CG14-23]|uniref:7TM domain-containing protein n=1 Tax=Aquimarina mycalae TaxID=3040073 RepID=UPI0024781E60|nr:7TM domain-containing protein [Aquimarina sp. 2201CG14-23]MDH7447333.1 7TM domain-containing protein [Aquimarina sp. 2201CG14-23]